jgi:hypothetical protein
MTLSPVSLDEVRRQLNLEESDGHDDDEDIWAATLSAAEEVENACGPVRPRTQVSKVCPRRGRLFLPVWPALSLTSVVDDDADEVDVALLDLDDDGYVRPLHVGLWLSKPRYTVTYTVGRDPIPQGLIDAVKVLAALEWENQRGPSQTNRYTATGGEGGPSGGLLRYQADKLMAPHRVRRVA